MTAELMKVSHSEAESYLSCRRKHFYGYVKGGAGFKPNVSGIALSAGSFLHAVLEVYYNHVLAAGDTNKEQRGALKKARDIAWDFYIKARDSGEYTDEEKTGRRTVKEALFDFYFLNEPFVMTGHVVQAVELSVSLELELDEDTTYQYPFVIDLIVVTPKGKTKIIDHKFAYDFYDELTIDLLTQLPKYLAGLRAGDFPADEAAYNIIRNRSKKDAKVEDVLRVQDVRPKTTTVENVFLEQLAVANEIITVRRSAEEEADELAFRSASAITCRSCDFSDICRSERVGANIGPALVVDFTPREDKPFQADLVIG